MILLVDDELQARATELTFLPAQGVRHSSCGVWRLGLALSALVSVAVCGSAALANSCVWKWSGLPDKGDPADEVRDEPTPNGAGINLGASGGTAAAELSPPAPAVGDAGITLVVSTCRRRK
jgi:hypothetical protein